jgi:hypothetical protein
MTAAWSQTSAFITISGIGGDTTPQSLQWWKRWDTIRTITMVAAVGSELKPLGSEMKPLRYELPEGI